MSVKIPLGISACLLGEQVRFDGGHKRLAFAVNELAPFVRFEPICPEMAIGLPTPRPALRLVKQDDEEIHPCLSQAGGAALPHQLHDWSAHRVKSLPWPPIEEGGRPHGPALRENFVGRICALHEFNQMWQRGLTRAQLIAFHSRYKLLMLAHSQEKYRELGPFVASMSQWDSLDAFAFEYRNRMMELLSHPASRRNHTNVLMHAQGYFRRQLSSPQRQELAELIDRYRCGVQPLLAPITMLKHYMSQYPHPWLTQQRYFDPYPEALRLRYGQ